MIVTDLRVKHLKKPLGYVMQPLLFSWKVKEEKMAKRQIWGRLRIYEENICLYDSGCSETISSLGTTIHMPLKPRTVYRWSVEVMADTGETACAENTFETGKMDEPWKGEWISFAMAGQELPVLKKEFVAEAVYTGRLYICCTGKYEAWMNGAKIGDEYLASGENTKGAVEIHTYDVSSLLKKGKNTMVLWLGQADSQVCCELYGDNRQLLYTEKSWEYAISPITYSDEMMGEIYDAQKAVQLEKREHWKKCEKISRKNESQKEKTIVIKKQKVPMRTDRYSLPIRCKDIFGQTLLTTPDKEKVFDFGQYITGWVEFENKMPEGMMVRLTVGTLHDGCFFCEKETKKAQFVYISAGRKEHIRPYFSVYQFRYLKIEVFEPDGTPSEQMISNILTEWKGVHLRRDSEQVGTVRTGVEYVNRLFLNAVWSRKNAMLFRTEDADRLYVVKTQACDSHDSSKEKLAENGMDLLLKEEYPGWLYGVRQGATTLLEDWDIVTAEELQKKGKLDRLKNSGYMQVEAWLYTYVCGIQLSQLDTKKIQIKPHADERLRFASASLETAAGTVKSAWKYNPDYTITYKVQIPFNTEADMILPGETLHITAGHYVIRK